jgi:EmrB/QacA subfamily drug resistance transporter
VTATSAAPPLVRSTQQPPWAALAVLATAQLMLVLDITVVNVALPDIGGALTLQRGQLPWVVTIYTLFFGGLMLLGGRIADLVGPRRATLAGLALFTASSLLCGASTGAPMLLTGRALQGIGAALMSPAALATVMTLFDHEHRGKALGVWSAISGVGLALGVILGGVLTSEAGWRWVFTINVPIGVALLIAIPLVARPGRPSPDVENDLDVPGAIGVTATTAAAIYGLVNAGSHGWAAPSTVAALVAAVGAASALAVVERRTAKPLLRLELLTGRPSLAGSFLMLVATGLMVGGFFIGSFSLQHAHGYSPLHVGVAFVPLAVATVAGAHVGGHLLTRLNARVIAVAGLALSCAGYTIAAAGHAAWVTVLGLSVAALGIGATFVTAFTAALSDAPPAEAGVRSALVNTFHELGGAAGVAVLSTAAGSALVVADAAGFTHAFALGAVAAGAAVLIAAGLVPTVLRKPTPGAPAH